MIIHSGSRRPRLRAETPGCTECFVERRHFCVQARPLAVEECAMCAQNVVRRDVGQGTMGFAYGAPFPGSVARKGGKLHKRLRFSVI